MKKYRDSLSGSAVSNLLRKRTSPLPSIFDGALLFAYTVSLESIGEGTTVTLSQLNHPLTYSAHVAEGESVGREIP